MIFKAVDIWADQSECGKYFVELCKVEGRFRHTAHYKPTPKQYAKVLGSRNTKAEAVQLCVDHAAQEHVNR